MQPDRSKASDTFVAAVSAVFGVLAWAQMPAVCGFMLSSTLVGADDWVYSLWLGGLIAVVGLGSGLPSLWRGARHPVLIAAVALSAAFLLCALLARGWYGAECRAVFTAMTPNWEAPK